MNNVKTLLLSRPKAVLLAYIVFIVGIITSIVFLIVNGEDRTFLWSTFFFVVVGSVIGLCDIFIHLRGMLIFTSTLAYVTAVGFHLYAALPSLSDLWNNVNFIGGNQNAAIVFGSIYIILTVILIIINFFDLSLPGVTPPPTHNR